MTNFFRGASRVPFTEVVFIPTPPLRFTAMLLALMLFYLPSLAVGCDRSISARAALIANLFNELVAGDAFANAERQSKVEARRDQYISCLLTSVSN